MLHSRSLRARLSRQGQSGVTLIETMIVLAIAVIMMALASSGAGMVRDYQVRKTASDVHLILLKARSEAMKRNSTLTLAPATGSDWKTAWNLTDGAEVVEKTGPFPDYTVIGEEDDAGGADIDSVSFLPNGKISSTKKLRFDVQLSGSAEQRVVKLDTFGRAKVICKRSGAEEACR